MPTVEDLSANAKSWLWRLALVAFLFIAISKMPENVVSNMRQFPPAHQGSQSSSTPAHKEQDSHSQVAGRRILSIGQEPTGRVLSHEAHGSSSGAGMAGFSWAPLVGAIVADALIILFFIGFRAAKEAHRRGSLMPHPETGRRGSALQGALEAVFGDPSLQQVSEIEAGMSTAPSSNSSSGSNGSNGSNGSSGGLSAAPGETSPHTWQAVLVLPTPVLALVMIHLPWGAFAASCPALLLLLAWVLHRRRKDMGSYCASRPAPPAGRKSGLLARIGRTCLYSFLSTSRATLGRALPYSRSGHRHAKLRTPIVTMVLVLVIQVVYFIEAASLVSDGNYLIYDLAYSAAGGHLIPGQLAWWWSIFTAVYNVGVDATGANMFLLAIYGLPAETAWGAWRTYLPVLPLTTLLYNAVPAAAGATGSSIVACALGGIVLTHSGLNAHRWPAAELPALFALHLWLWLFMVPVSYFFGGVCVQCHGVGLLYGSLSGLLLAPAFSDAPLAGSCCAPQAAAIPAKPQRADLWRWGWCALGGVSLIAAALATTLAGWPAEWMGYF